jgi:hypothetical protein
MEGNHYLQVSNPSKKMARLEIEFEKMKDEKNTLIIIY